MDFCEQWIENDYNPFILFNNSGKIISLNQEAQFLLGETTSHEIFRLASTYANTTYGFKTTMQEVELGAYKFFGFTIGYEVEDTIGIKLYRCTKQTFNEPDTNKDKANIYTILDLCISAISVSKDINFIKNFDPTLPELWLNLEEFTKLLTKTYSAYENNETITTTLKLKTGEYIRYQNKKYPIFTILIEGKKRDQEFENTIIQLGKKAGVIIRFFKNQTIIDSPLKVV